MLSASLNKPFLSLTFQKGVCWNVRMAACGTTTAHASVRSTGLEPHVVFTPLRHLIVIYQFTSQIAGLFLEYNVRGPLDMQNIHLL